MFKICPWEIFLGNIYALDPKEGCYIISGHCSVLLWTFLVSHRSKYFNVSRVTE